MGWCHRNPSVPEYRDLRLHLRWKWTGLPERTLWDWLSLLIVPVVLALGGYLFTRSENRRTQEVADQQ